MSLHISSHLSLHLAGLQRGHSFPKVSVALAGRFWVTVVTYMRAHKSQKKQHQDDLGDLHCQPAGVLGSAHLCQQDPRAALDPWEGF